MFSLQVVGAVAQLERALIAERTTAGRRPARRRARGRNPGLRAGDPGSIRKLRAGCDVVRVLNHTTDASWTAERLRRTVRLLQQIAAQLEAMRERTPRGGSRWRPSSVRHLLARAEPERRQRASMLSSER
jgi:hypothetical protein